MARISEMNVSPGVGNASWWSPGPYESYLGSFGHGKSRGYMFSVGQQGGTMLRIEDEAGPYLADMARLFPAEMRRSLRATGFWLKGELAKAMRTGNVPGTSWPRKASRAWQNFNYVKSAAERSEGDPFANSRRPGRVYGDLWRAVGYWQGRDDMTVQIGFRSRPAARMMGMLQAGVTTAVTPRVRRAAFALGLPLSKGKTVLKIPARPVVAPLYRHLHAQIIRRIETRLQVLLQGYGGREATMAQNAMLALEGGAMSTAREAA